MINVAAVILFATTYHCYYGYDCSLSSVITFTELESTYTCTVRISMNTYIYIYMCVHMQTYIYIIILE